MAERKTVGFVITNLTWSEEDREMLQGADLAAKKYDVNLLVLPGHEINATWYEGADFHNYEYQFNSLYSFLQPEMIDGLIMKLDNISYYLNERQFQGFLNWLPEVPTIFEGRKVPGYCFAHTEEVGFRDMLRTLVEDCGYRDILMVSGPDGNTVADARLKIYREMLECHAIPYEQEKVFYGTFCEWGMDGLKDFIAGQKQVPQAICVANDTMAVLVYRVLEELNLRPGIDVAVTGCDNIHQAPTLHPPLATVKKSSGLLGYRMVEAMVQTFAGETLPDEIAVGDQAIYRRSLGGVAEAMRRTQEEAFICEMASGSEHMLDALKKMLYEHTSMDICYVNELQTVWEWYEETVKWLCRNELPPAGARNHGIAHVLDSRCMDYISIEELEYILKVLRTMVICRIPQEHQQQWQSMLMDWGILVHNKFIQQIVAVRDVIGGRQNHISAMVKTMLFFEEEEKIYYGLMNHLQALGVHRSYMYVLTTPIEHKSSLMNNFQLPKRFLQKYCMRPGYWKVLPLEQQLIKVKDFWGGEHSQEDSARTMVLHPLFTNTTIYGFMLCEMPYELLSVTEAMCQSIGAALHAMNLKSTLQTTLERVRMDNTELDIKAKTDVLTGIYNRRGFLEEAMRIFQNKPSTEIPVGFLMFIDLDNLKSINDNFGHEEGDFAICQAVRMVKSCIRVNDVFARIGGDEFVVAAISKEQPAICKLRENIKRVAREYNEISDKPYNVEMSIGIHFFPATEPVDISHILDMADDALYEDKRKKNVSAVKTPKNV